MLGRTKASLCAAAAATALGVGALGIVAGPAGADPGHWGGDAGPGPWGPPASSVGCGHGGSATIGDAVTAAAPHATILVCRGTYREQVVIPPTKPLSIVGVGNPVIDATGFDNGVQVLASGSQVRGLTVEHATGEGILVQGVPGTPIDGVTVSGNTVVRNDQGNTTGAPQTNSPYQECNGSAQAPGDCGEGIHLMVAEHSSVVGNDVSDNSGGILLTDEFGPTHDNLVAFNTVSDNTLDCGITVAGHNPNAFSAGAPQPAAGGIFGNRIVFNSVSGNGIAGQGAGVLLATPLPGGAVYGNQVEGNRIWGNGLAGVTVHGHAPGQDLNGNVVEENLIGTNNLDGDPDFYPAVDPSTTGVIVATVSPVSIIITHNLIANDVYGIWMLPAVNASGTLANLFVHVQHAVQTAP